MGSSVAAQVDARVVQESAGAQIASKSEILVSDIRSLEAVVIIHKLLKTLQTLHRPVANQVFLGVGSRGEEPDEVRHV
jgi:hypothetical protein